jgi:hypothetical protein
MLIEVPFASYQELNAPKYAIFSVCYLAVVRLQRSILDHHVVLLSCPDFSSITQLLTSGRCLSLSFCIIFLCLAFLSIYVTRWVWGGLFLYMSICRRAFHFEKALLPILFCFQNSIYTWINAQFFLDNLCV